MENISKIIEELTPVEKVKLLLAHNGVVDGDAILSEKLASLLSQYRSEVIDNCSKIEYTSRISEWRLLDKALAGVTDNIFKFEFIGYPVLCSGELKNTGKILESCDIRTGITESYQLSPNYVRRSVQSGLRYDNLQIWFASTVDILLTSFQKEIKDERETITKLVEKLTAKEVIELWNDGTSMLSSTTEIFKENLEYYKKVIEGLMKEAV